MNFRNDRPKALTVALLSDWFWDLRAKFYRIALIKLRDSDKAEDATSATYQRATEKLSSYSPQLGTVEQWLTGICRLVCLEEARRNRKISTTTTLDDLASTDRARRGGKKNGR